MHKQLPASAIIKNLEYDATKLHQAYNCIIVTSNHCRWLGEA